MIKSRQTDAPQRKGTALFAALLVLLISSLGRQDWFMGHRHNVKLVLPGIENAAVSLEKIKSESTSPWSVEDFDFEEKKIPGTSDSDGNLDVEYCVTGLSKEGRKKLKKRKRLILPPVGKNGRIPYWVNEDAFAGLEIEEVEVPGNYTHIQYNAFSSCRIKKLILQEGIVYINQRAFAGNHIEEVAFPSTFRYAATGSFKNNRLKKVVFPEQVEIIAEEAFMDNAIEEVEFKGPIRHIFERAFAGNQLKEVSIPATLKNRLDKLPGIYPDALL